MKHLPIIAIIAAGALSLTVANAATTSSLQSKISKKAGRSELVTHCAGLFHSVWDYLGEAELGAKKSREMKRDVAKLMDAGAKFRVQEKGGSTSKANKVIVAEAFSISTVYFKRYTARAAKTGNAFKGDRRWKSEVSSCRSIINEL